MATPHFGFAGDVQFGHLAAFVKCFTTFDLLTHLNELWIVLGQNNKNNQVFVLR